MTVLSRKSPAQIDYVLPVFDYPVLQTLRLFLFGAGLFMPLMADKIITTSQHS